MDDKVLESWISDRPFGKKIHFYKSDNGKYFIRYKVHWWQRGFPYIILDDTPMSIHPKYFDTEKEAFKWIYAKKREVEKYDFFYKWLLKDEI